MKKILLVLASIVLLSGCVKINDLSIEQIANNAINTKTKITNQYRTGYKYYLPRGLSIIDKKDFNEQLNTDLYTYYLYVDIVSYHNKVKEEYIENKSAYYSKTINNNDKFGYIEIKKLDEKYLVEIMYNYAKIEVIVNKRDLNSTIANCFTILNSIKYNDNIVSNIMGDNVLQYKETEINIFKNKKNDSNYINYEEIYGQYEEKNETHDSDLID